MCTLPVEILGWKQWKSTLANLNTEALLEDYQVAFRIVENTDILGWKTWEN